MSEEDKNPFERYISDNIESALEKVQRERREEESRWGEEKSYRVEEKVNYKGENGVTQDIGELVCQGSGEVLNEKKEKERINYWERIAPFSGLIFFLTIAGSMISWAISETNKIKLEIKKDSQFIQGRVIEEIYDTENGVYTIKLRTNNNRELSLGTIGTNEAKGALESIVKDNSRVEFRNGCRYTNDIGDFENGDNFILRYAENIKVLDNGEK